MSDRSGEAETHYAILVVWHDGESEYLKEGEGVAIFTVRGRAEEAKSFMMAGMADDVQSINVVPAPRPLEGRAPVNSALYVPTDADAANEEWGANCGPCAVAALLGREVKAVRDLFDGWPGYTNPTMIKRVLERAGRVATASTEQRVQQGLGFVQFEGPRESGGARAAYRHTHWVALARRPWLGLDAGQPAARMVYDAAVGEKGGWVQIGAFSALIVPLYIENDRGATGWRFRQVLEVTTGTKSCTCGSPRAGQGSRCRGAEDLGVGWHCAGTGELGRAGSGHA